MMRRYVYPKRRFLQEQHGVTSQKTTFLIVTAVKTSILHGIKMIRNGEKLPLLYYLVFLPQLLGLCSVGQDMERIINGYWERTLILSALVPLGTVLSQENPTKNGPRLQSDAFRTRAIG
jgi:hypothetical protein